MHGQTKILVCPYASWNNKLPGVGRTPLFLLFTAARKHDYFQCRPRSQIFDDLNLPVIVAEYKSISILVITFFPTLPSLATSPCYIYGSSPYSPNH